MSKVIIISSVSGGGKTTIIDQLRNRHPSLVSAITATSRAPRPGEENGKHYYFYTYDDFKNKIEQGYFLEYANVHGNFYGIPLAPVEEKLQHGYSVILNIDVQGMKTVRSKLGNRCLSIFILPPDRKTREERLRQRGTDSEDVISVRLENGTKEMEEASSFDYRIINDRLEKAVYEIEEILKKENVIV